MTDTEYILNLFSGFRVIEENIAALDTDAREMQTDIENAPEIFTIDGNEPGFGGGAAVTENFYLTLPERAGPSEIGYFPGQDTADTYSFFERADRTERVYTPEIIHDMEEMSATEFREAASISHALNEDYDLTSEDVLFLEQDQREIVSHLNTAVYSESLEAGGDMAASFEIADTTEIPPRTPDIPGEASAVMEFVAGEGAGSRTTEIRVDARSTNTVASSMDLDEMTAYIGEKLREAMYAAAEGVH